MTVTVPRISTHWPVIPIGGRLASGGTSMTALAARVARLLARRRGSILSWVALLAAFLAALLLVAVLLGPDTAPIHDPRLSE